MADKKISALSSVADSDIGSDDLLHIVDNPGGTPVNKKMTIGQLFENVPTHLAINDIVTESSAATDLAASSTTIIDGSSFTADVAFTLDDGTDVGQIKFLSCSGMAASYAANITVSSWHNSGVSAPQIVLNAQGEGCILVWNGSVWLPVANSDATISNA